MKPKLHLYKLKDEEVAILSCDACDFTIVVVEVDKLQSESLKEIPENDKTIIATHNSFK